MAFRRFESFKSGKDESFEIANDDRRRYGPSLLVRSLLEYQFFDYHVMMSGLFLSIIPECQVRSCLSHHVVKAFSCTIISRFSTMGWVYNLQDQNAPSSAPKLVAIALVLTSLATLAVLLRLAIRFKTKKPFALDDAAVIFALVGFHGYFRHCILW